MRAKYIRGLRRLFVGMRRHIQHGSSYGVVDSVYQQISGYVNAGYWTDIIM